MAQAEKWYDKEMGVAARMARLQHRRRDGRGHGCRRGRYLLLHGRVPFALAVTDGAPIKVVGVAVDTGGADNCVIYKKEAIDRANAHELEGRKVACR